MDTPEDKVTNLEFLKTFSQNDPVRIDKYLMICLKSVPPQVILLKKRLEEKNWKAVSDIAHTLKSQAIYMGIESAGGLLRKTVDSAGKKTNLDQIPGWIEELDIIFEKAFIELEDFRSRISLNKTL